MDISKKLIPNTFGSVLALTIISFVVIYIWFGCSDFPERDQLKESLTLTATFFSAYATLGAAYIAANLFNDWRAQKKYEIIAQLTLDASLDLIRAKDTFHFYLFQYIYKTDEITYKQVDDVVFHAISKIDLLNQVLERYNMPNITNEVNKLYRESYCKLPRLLQEKKYLMKLSEIELTKYSEKSFDGLKELNEKMLANLKI
ncbi:hypothetical protein [Acinetobacter gerneri]|uniref:Uncharacterized protein n=1 Tax=Acinetobacter gerneri DSM 14967 = CIP 107464 = MTCC 9824 TaxID=1120926 RepID=N8YCD5_9GAMM|nr:hypothetical protein [Acinetobacter gerneri]ENV34301.1 hypothetical protein F960_01620 [Acinetobacter gerneri DSM 14967 = CIP 107464 = MTCC 9824]EPR84972.1 hypothetical protein L289_0820 [Acinetobacter gerneri DSM 14967 = CIP 107464 = MTCC 9824]